MHARARAREKETMQLLSLSHAHMHTHTHTNKMSATKQVTSQLDNCTTQAQFLFKWCDALSHEDVKQRLEKLVNALQLTKGTLEKTTTTKPDAGKLALLQMYS